MNSLFDDLDPDGYIVWGRQRHGKGSKSGWHIVGPRLPRIAPVSPSSVSPCGTLLYSDDLDTTTTRPDAACHFCAAFLDSRARQKSRAPYPRLD
jgi:hypothetical protein